MKPVFSFPQDVAKRLEALGDYRFLIVGATLFKSCTDWLKFGFFYHETKFWSEAVFIQDSATKKYGFIEPIGGWDNRITGEYKGDDFDWIYYGNNDVMRMWKEAGNTVQWKKR